MIKLDQKAEILMKYFRENMSQRAIAREMKVFRTTVRKYINDYESKCEEIEELAKDNNITNSDTLNLVSEMVSAPKYDTSKRTRIKLTDEIIEKINELIKENERNRLLGRHKQLMKKIDIHEKLIELGFDISYPTVCNYIRDNHEKKEAFIRQEYDLGETLEFDWGEVKITIGGKPTTFQMGLLTTACGSHHYARLYQNQKMENFLDIHVQAFNSMGRVHREFEKYDLIVADELGYISFDKEGSELLFTFLSLRAERKSTIITTNLSFDRWNEIFNDPVLTAALIDRLTHKSYVINMNGDSYRIKETREWLEETN